MKVLNTVKRLDMDDVADFSFMAVIVMVGLSMIATALYVLFGG